jgi:GT2 family glycosyltransferase
LIALVDQPPAVFITTFDRPEILRSTIRAFLEQTLPPAEILVIDNGVNASTPLVVESFRDAPVRYHRMGYNAGPAGAAAYGLRRLAEVGHEWIVCGDDDDPPLTSDTLERLMRLALRAGGNLGAVGVTGARWDWHRSGRRIKMDLPERGIVDVDVIGGSKLPTIHRDVVMNVGVHNPALFFGQEEFEYCLRIRKAGYRIAVDAELFRRYVNHPQFRSKMLPRGVLRSRHDVWRDYYNTRNYIYFMRNVFCREDLALLEVGRAGARSVRSWKQGVRYGAVFTYMQLLGVLHALIGRLGVTVKPSSKYKGDSL